jgi:hypothetical protein
MMKKGIVILVYAAVCPWPRKFPQRSNRAFFGDGLETAKTREYYKTGSQQFQHATPAIIATTCFVPANRCGNSRQLL